NSSPFLFHWVGRKSRMGAIVFGSVLCRAGGRAQIALAEIAVSLRQVPGNGVVTLLQRFQDPLAVRSEIEAAAEDHMKGRIPESELPVFDGAEIGPVVGIAGRILAQHQNDLAVAPPEIGQDAVLR